jgi:hypothetical protein
LKPNECGLLYPRRPCCIRGKFVGHGEKHHSTSGIIERGRSSGNANKCTPRMNYFSTNSKLRILKEEVTKSWRCKHEKK